MAKSDIVYAVNSVAERSERQLRKQLYFSRGKFKVLIQQVLIFFERKIQGSALAGSYISLEEVILYLPQLSRKGK